MAISRRSILKAGMASSIIHHVTPSIFAQVPLSLDYRFVWSNIATDLTSIWPEIILGCDQLVDVRKFAEFLLSDDAGAFDARESLRTVLINQLESKTLKLENELFNSPSINPQEFLRLNEQQILAEVSFGISIAAIGTSIIAGPAGASVLGAARASGLSMFSSALSIPSVGLSTFQLYSEGVNQGTALSFVASYYDGLWGSFSLFSLSARAAIDSAGLTLKLINAVPLNALNLWVTYYNWKAAGARMDEIEMLNNRRTLLLDNIEQLMSGLKNSLDSSESFRRHLEQTLPGSIDVQQRLVLGLSSEKCALPKTIPLTQLFPVNMSQFAVAPA